MPRAGAESQGRWRAAPGRARRRAGALREGAGRTLRSVGTPAGVRGVAVEAGWVAAHAVAYPLGVFAERTHHPVERFSLAGLPPLQRGLMISDVEAAGTPILLLHGMIDNRSVFTRLRSSLRRRGFGRVVTMNYSPFASDVPAAARALGGMVERLCTDTGYERVHVVGHSLGGVIARFYVQRLGGDARVHTLVTLGSPHGGTRMAQLLPAGVARHLRPDSGLIRELAQPAAGCRTRFVAFASDLDQFMVPSTCAEIDHPDLHARNIRLRGVGHASLPYSGRVVHEIATTLAHLDLDGLTVAAGATPIASRAGETPTGPSRPARLAARGPEPAAPDQATGCPPPQTGAS